MKKRIVIEYEPKHEALIREIKKHAIDVGLPLNQLTLKMWEEALVNTRSHEKIDREVIE